MASFSRDVLENSWRTRDDAAVVREVATKGEFVDICVNYLARKRGTSLEAGRRFFEEHSDAYVTRLLTDKLVFKAEDVLKNLKRNYRGVYFQFAFECKEEETKAVILEHLKKKDPVNFDEELSECEFYWRLLKIIEKCPCVLENLKKEMQVFTLDRLLARDEEYRTHLVVEVFFTSGSDELIPRLQKGSVWKYLIEKNLSSEIIVWFQALQNDQIQANKFKLFPKYKSWIINKNMVEFAGKYLKSPSECLRNCFAGAGYIFPDEKDNVKMTLRRVYTTGSASVNKHLLPPNLPMGQYLWDNKLYTLLLEDFVSIEELKRIKENQSGPQDELDLILATKTEDLESRGSAQTFFSEIIKYLRKKTADPSIPTLMTELLIDDSATLEDLQKKEKFKPLRDLPFFKRLIKKSQEESGPKVTALEMLKKFKNIDLDAVSKDAGDEPVSFNNSHLSQKYSQKVKLNYIHYLKQHRSSYAVYQFFLEQLQGYSNISPFQLYASAEVVCDFAIQNYSNDDLVLHSVAFIEMLGFDSQVLRSVIKLLRIIPKPLPVDSSGVISYSDLIEVAEKTIISNCGEITAENFPLQEYEALMKVANAYQLKKMPELILMQLAQKDDWWKVLVLLQYFNIPLTHGKKILRSFRTPTIGDNLLRALSFEPHQGKSKRRASLSRQRSFKSKTDSVVTTTSGDIVVSSTPSTSEPSPLFKSSRDMKFLPEGEDIDIFAIILMSSNNIPEEEIVSFEKLLEVLNDPHSYSTSVNLMKNAIKYDRPVLCVLAAVVSDLNLRWFWLVYLAVATKNMRVLETAKSTEELVLRLVESSVQGGYVRTMNRCFQVFYKEEPFTHFTKFLQLTVDLDYSEETIDFLRLYLLAWSNEEVTLPLTKLNKVQIIELTVRLLIWQLKCNLYSGYYQQLLLNVICQSGISDINQTVDFCQLKCVFEIISFTGVTIDFEKLLIKSENPMYVHSEYEKTLYTLKEINEYDKAIELTILLGLPVSEVVFSKWVNSVGPEKELAFETYEKETERYSLAPELLMKFYLDVAYQIAESTPKKYLLHKKSLDVFKRNHLLPNECFDCDQIEYEMILCYLQSEQTIEDLDIYHSEYFEEILMNERCVLYKSFAELKSLAGIEDLTTSLKVELTEQMKLKLACLLNKLLDLGDIVEALRLQAMFEYRPLDLHFIVFCMGLAEGLTNINDLPKDEREMLADVEKSSITKFDKRTLGRMRPNLESIGREDTVESNTTAFGFEEIPSREKREVLDALQGIASRLKYGIDLGKRIVMVYRAAMHLEKDYLDVLRMKDTSYLLKSATEEDCLHKFLVVSDILMSTKMTHIEIADYLSCEIATAIIRPRFYIFRSDQPGISLSLHTQNVLWGRHDLDKEFHLFLELCPKTTILGNAILAYCDALKLYRKFQDKKDYEQELTDNPQLQKAFTSLCEIIQEYGQPSNQSTTTQVLSHKKQNTICVELIIKAHDCFVHECSMEGIASVLSRAKALNTVLSTAKSWSLIVRMLTGIARYREMYYCFETLIKNDQFESLLGQFDEEKSNGLRQAVISYIQEHCPENKECLKLAALHFLMYKELAEMWEQEANSMTAKLLSENQATDDNSGASKGNEDNRQSTATLKCSTNVITDLNHILDNLTHAAENYLLDNNLKLASKSAYNAELLAMQIDLVTKGLNTPTQVCICILNIRSKAEFKELVKTELSVPQALIASRSYSYEINWSEAILSQYILLGRNEYLEDYLNHMELQDSMIETIVRNFQLHNNVLPRMEENLAHLVELVESVTLKYKLASILGFKRIIEELINGECIYYLKDTNYGRKDFPE